MAALDTREMIARLVGSPSVSSTDPRLDMGNLGVTNLLAEWLDRLEGNGSAELVVSKHLGSDSLADWLRDRGHTVERVASRRGFRLLSVAGRPRS